MYNQTFHVVSLFTLITTNIEIYIMELRLIHWTKSYKLLTFAGNFSYRNSKVNWKESGQWRKSTLNIDDSVFTLLQEDLYLLPTTLVSI